LTLGRTITNRFTFTALFERFVRFVLSFAGPASVLHRDPLSS
jgi:hypothetical protein